MGSLDQPDMTLRVTREEERLRQGRRHKPARRRGSAPTRRSGTSSACSSPSAVLVEAENKRHARVKVIETVIAAAEDGMRRNGMAPP